VRVSVSTCLRTLDQLSLDAFLTTPTPASARRDAQCELPLIGVRCPGPEPSLDRLIACRQQPRLRDRDQLASAIDFHRVGRQRLLAVADR
jgi:hypothetical protein